MISSAMQKVRKVPEYKEYKFNDWQKLMSDKENDSFQSIFFLQMAVV
jgi:hypothetical protein